MAELRAVDKGLKPLVWIYRWRGISEGKSASRVFAEFFESH
jgi:hypothetical protein